MTKRSLVHYNMHVCDLMVTFLRSGLKGKRHEEKGSDMHVFEWWGGEYRPLEELITEMAEVKKNNK